VKISASSRMLRFARASKAMRTANVKIHVNARRPGESASAESEAERAGPPADWRAQRAQAAGLDGGASRTSAVAATREAAAKQ
jgi:hypothetical protein